MHSDDDREAVMDDVDDDPGFAAWCERMALSRLRRCLKLGLPISARGMATLRRFGVIGTAGSLVVRFVERPDPSGARWATALGLLLEAGRGAML
jgi:hypothetical protein